VSDLGALNMKFSAQLRASQEKKSTSQDSSGYKAAGNHKQNFVLLNNLN